ncbi:MAG: lysylphosphatidylglycerol synthase domain-containing protein [Anaerolineae bacterium]
MDTGDWLTRLDSMWQQALSFLNRGRVGRIALVSLFGLVLISLVALSVREWEQIEGWLHHITAGLLLKIFAVYTGALVLAALTWYLIIRRLSGATDARIHLRVYCITNLARRLPGVLWHVVGRAVLYEQAGLSKTTTVLASGVEQVLIVLSGVLVYLVSLVVTSGTAQINIIWLIITMLAGILTVHPRLLGAILRRWGQQEALSVRYQDLAVWLALCIITWIAGGYMAIIVVNSNQPLSLVEQVEIIGAWSLSGSITSLVTFLPAGLGVREVSLVVLLGPSIGWPFATFVAVILRLLITLFEIIWGAIAWRAGGPAIIAKKEY